MAVIDRLHELRQVRATYQNSCMNYIIEGSRAWRSCAARNSLGTATATAESEAYNEEGDHGGILQKCGHCSEQFE